MQEEEARIFLKKKRHIIMLGCLVGGLSSAVLKVATAPLHRAKILVQAEGELLRLGHIARPFGGFVSALKHVAHTEGMSGLFRGTLAELVSYYPVQALNFFLQDTIHLLFKMSKEQHGYAAWFLANLAKGTLAGGLSLLVVYPLGLAATVLAADVIEPQLGRETYTYSSMAGVCRKTLEHSGISGLYSGFGASLLGIVVYRATYFGLYDLIRAKFNESFLMKFLLGWTVTMLAGLLAYPFDTVRKRMMLAAATPMAYTSMLDCVLTIAREEGVGAFFAGALSNTLRSMVASIVLNSIQLFHVRREGGR